MSSFVSMHVTFQLFILIFFIYFSIDYLYCSTSNALSAVRIGSSLPPHSFFFVMFLSILIANTIINFVRLYLYFYRFGFLYCFCVHFQTFEPEKKRLMQQMKVVCDDAHCINSFFSFLFQYPPDMIDIGCFVSAVLAGPNVRCTMQERRSSFELNT